MRVRDRSALHEGISWREGTRQAKVLQKKERQPTSFAWEKGDCPGGIACDYRHPPECAFSSKSGITNLGRKCVCVIIREKGWERTKDNEIILWLSPTQWITPMQRISSVRSYSLRRERPSARRVSYFNEINFFRNIVNKMDNKFRLVRVAERFVQEREKQGPTMEIMQQGGQSSRSPNACRACNTEVCSQESMGLTRTHLQSLRDLFSSM